MLRQQPYTEAELLDGLKAGNEKCFSALYSLYAEILTRYAASKLASLEEARDVMHDLFVDIWSKRESVEIKSSLKQYLFTAIKYKVIDHIRKNSSRQVYQKMMLELNKFVETPDHLLELKDLQQKVNRALETMSVRVREIYLLSREEDLSISQIAEKLSLSEQTVKNQISSALKILRKFLVTILFFIILCR
ncbi:RNA polymerase sigma-70 factor, ECF subfamily [bacterium A37T11]|nr:RNA polymerase sigma-70 factor, ECF subfamily [bacterium A37T11]